MFIFSVCVAGNNSPVGSGCSSPDHWPLDLVPHVYPMYCLDSLSVGQHNFILGKSKIQNFEGLLIYDHKLYNNRCRAAFTVTVVLIFCRAKRYSLVKYDPMLTPIV